MKAPLIAIAVLFALPTAAQQPWGMRLETDNDARDRISSERWHQYQERRSQPGLSIGGPFGVESSPPGTAQPGYVPRYQPYPSGRSWDGGRESPYR